ncbi:MAG: 30S ribosomal protein S1 [Gemmatimonadota bacterium]
MTAPTTPAPITARERQKIQKAQLRPLANLRPELYDEDDYSADELEAMMAMYNGTMASIDEGEIVSATVLEIRDNLVILDVGFKSEGAIPVEEFRDLPDLKAGDTVEVLLENLEDQNGAVVLSKKKADFMRVWEKIRVAYESDQPVEGVLVKKIKGGVVVDLMGVEAFLPGSQIALRRVPNIDELLGQKYEFKIIKLNKRRRNIVVSRRVILEQERAGKREKLMKELAKDQVRKGVVKNITDFGAFIDLGGVDGLLHITDMSWGRIQHPTEMVQIGMELEVKVLDIDWERERISLGLKQLQAYPWKDVAARYPVGTRVSGKVVTITKYGAFFELEPGIDGLVHISDMSWTKRVQHPSEVVKKGDAVNVVILNIDSENKRISLGLKQATEDPWLKIGESYPVGTELRGTVARLMEKGVVVDMGNDLEGFVPISQLPSPKAITSPAEVVYDGMFLDLRILEVDPIHRRIVLTVTDIPAEQPPRPETIKIHKDDEDESAEG